MREADAEDGAELAAPIAPPSERKKVVELVAAPMSRISTEFWTATTIV